MSKILNLSEASYLALHGLVHIASKTPDRISVKEIASVLHASEAHLSKIFQKLTRVGIVNSIRGPQGGFELSRSPKHVSFLEIIEIFEGEIEVTGCPFGKKNCVFNKCIIDKEVGEATKVIYDRFKNMYLSDFL
ncbi:MAG: Rrf2 family transcriptional regulator [Candidatus Cloacimonadales bacterium]